LEHTAAGKRYFDMEKSFTIHDLPESERPRERLQKFGPEKLASKF